MHFQEFSRMNRRRCETVDGFNHPLKAWSTSDWFTATMGELGEAANCAKKLNRSRDGIPGNTEDDAELWDKMRLEIADTFIYLDLMSQAIGFDLEEAVLEKFAITSRKLGYVDPGSTGDTYA